MKKNIETVAVLGASGKEDRYSNQAVNLLVEKGYNVIPVNPSGVEICGIQSTKSLNEIDVSVDTLTMYVNSSRSNALIDDILSLNPNRIIFNPGSENYDLADKCKQNGIEVEEACTLVLLNTDQF